VISHVSKGILTRESEPFPGLDNDLKSIPLWPVFHPSSPDHLVSATYAFTAVDDHLLVPWMKDSSRFVLPSFLGESSRHKECLTKLGVRELAIEVLFQNYVLPMPSTLSVIYWQYYEPLISALAGIYYHSPSWNSLLPILTDIAIAADGNCELKKTSQLYDHEDRIFASAFRHQAKTRFLHPSVQKHRYFWKRVGLRQLNDLINAADFIQCLQVVKLRINAEDAQNDPDLERDLQTVLSPLIDRSFSTRDFNARDWQAISQERVFRSRTDFSSEPEYRRDAMATVAIDTALPLSEVVLHEHATICWSQTPFVMHEPTREVLGKIVGHGYPEMDMVWRHLQYMKIISESLKGDHIQDFLTELNLIYQYLQDHLVDSTAGFALGNSAVWLNLHTSDYSKVQLEDIDSSWQGLENLVLSSSCDAGPIQAVRPGLTRFETLLRGLGCSSISYPTLTRPTLHTDRSVSKSLQQLRKEEKLLDITYSTEGKLIKAHKVVLAAMSEKCALQFNSRWTQEDCIKYDENTDPDAYMSYHTLSTMIKYAYEEDIDWKAMEVLDDDDEETRATKLDLLLDLHMGADCWLIPTLKSQVEDKILVAGKAFVNLSNVVEIRARAEMVRAMEFERWCAEIIRENQHIVDKARSGH
jgi:sacsin